MVSRRRREGSGNRQDRDFEGLGRVMRWEAAWRVGEGLVDSDEELADGEGGDMRRVGACEGEGLLIGLEDRGDMEVAARGGRGDAGDIAVMGEGIVEGGLADGLEGVRGCSSHGGKIARRKGRVKWEVRMSHRTGRVGVAITLRKVAKTDMNTPCFVHRERIHYLYT